jgi:nicotinamidase-related amidase
MMFPQSKRTIAEGVKLTKPVRRLVCTKRIAEGAKNKMPNWLDAIPQKELATYRRAGFGGRRQAGENPALLVIDVTYAFTGDPGQTLEEAIEKYVTACGPVAWRAMPQIARLIDRFRANGHSVIYTRSSPRNTPYSGRATKSTNLDAAISDHDNSFPDAIAPRAGDWILEKTKASAFFETPLASALRRQKVDTLFVCGVSTSGCVRASVVDGFSHGFDVFVVDDCCFDRSDYSHCSNLFDMDAKYGTVLSLEESLDVLAARKD